MIALGQHGRPNRFYVAASGLVPGDTIERAVTLTNTGNQDLSSVTLTTVCPHRPRASWTPTPRTACR